MNTAPPAPTGSLPANSRLISVGDLLARTDATIRAGVAPGATVLPSGFEVLDETLAGGFRSGELILVGGPQGLGKTTMAMQMVRNVVHAGGSAVVFSYEHEAHTLLERLLSLEAAEVHGPGSARLHPIRRAFEAAGAGAETIEDRLRPLPGAIEALEVMRGYGGRLHVHESSGVDTDLAEIEATVAAVQRETGSTPFVLVDYLQKVPVPGSGLSEEARITTVVGRLKDLTLTLGVPIVAIVAAEKASLTAGHRMRAQDLRGSSALAYEADIVLMLGDKYDLVARHHLVYDLANAERFRNWVVLTVEKNRHGVDKVELEFEKQFEQGRFDPRGGRVVEQLLEERVFTE